MLIAEGITVRIGKKTIVKEIEARIVPGEVLAVLGPNGAGKSTLLRVLSGEIEPDTGRVLLEGTPVSRSTCRLHARQRGVMSQQSNLSFPFTALEVVLMGRIPHQHRGAETPHDLEIASAALARADVFHLGERSYPTLSGGEQQRVHFARVLAQIWEAPAAGARYLLLDEPTSSLDLAHQHETLSIARDLAREGVGVGVVLHDLNLAAEYADRILLMKNGELYAEGTPRQILTARNIEEVYALPAIVQQHPDLEHPLIITCSPRRSGASGRQNSFPPATSPVGYCAPDSFVGSRRPGNGQADNGTEGAAETDHRTHSSLQQINHTSLWKL